MKFKSSLIDQASGSLGGRVFEKNGVVRTRNIPGNPNTSYQTAARSRMTAAAISWRDTLTQSQRDGWNAYALTLSKKDALGKDIKSTGIGAYVAANTIDTTLVAGPFTAAPATAGALLLPAVTAIVFDDSANTVVVTFADVIPATAHVNLYLSPGPVSVGRSSYTGPFRLTNVQTGSGANSLTFVLPASYVTGEKIGWKLKAFDDEGRVSRDQIGTQVEVA